MYNSIEFKNLIQFKIKLLIKATKTRNKMKISLICLFYMLFGLITGKYILQYNRVCKIQYLVIRVSKFITVVIVAHNKYAVYAKKH